jgi:cyanophycinase-like exopeptidase
MAPPMNEMLENPEAQEKFIAQCNTACAIFFCGGDQSFIANVIHTVPGLNDFLVKLYEDGVPLAGTSAGCAVMSHTMLTGEGLVEKYTLPLYY